MVFFSLTITFNNFVYAQDPSITNNADTDKNFNIAVASDWGCKEDAEKTAKNIQSHNPELVIAGGDLSYKESGACWIEIIAPFKEKTTISMGDHEYPDTYGGKAGALNNYLKPLGIPNTYYSFNLNNVHFVAID